MGNQAWPRFTITLLATSKNIGREKIIMAKVTVPLTETPLRLSLAADAVKGKRFATTYQGEN